MPRKRSPGSKSRLFAIALGCAATFELLFALGGSSVLADQVGDAFQVISITGYYNYYDCPDGCDDGNACTTDACVDGDCQHSPVQCDDDNACNGEESCNPSSGCVVGDPPQCDDGDACNGLEGCDPASGCTPGTPIECDDGNVCTEDECDPETGFCEHPPTNEGGCCEPDGNDCTEDVCDDGACVHPPKDDPSPMSPTVSWSTSKNFGKNADLPIIGRALGVKSQFFVNAEAGVAGEEDECSAEGSVGGGATVRVEFIGQTFEITGEASGGWGCAAPTKCPEGCDNRLQCDLSKLCCSGSGEGSISLTRGFEKRFGTKFGSLYLRASVGGGVEGAASKTWPSCAEDHWSVTLGMFVEGSAGGGVEVCNWLTKRICGCQQGRDPWTGRFETACSDCSRCSPYAGGSVSGRLGGSVTWSDQGFSGDVTGQVCFTVSSIQVGPVEFEGYQACWP